MRLLGVGALFLAGLVLCVVGYASGRNWPFFAGALLVTLSVGPLAWWAGRASLPAALLRVGAFLFLYLLVLLVAEGGLRVARALRPEPELRSFYTYTQARSEPEGFRLWWKHRMQRWFRISAEFTIDDPRGENPFVLRPGARFMRHQSDVRINALGFRGPEIERAKRGRFRIVALGESTTFGLTLLPDDRPWPEVLQERIRQEYSCEAPIEVVNAGVPGWTIANQIKRLEHDVLPLDPDVLLSYHGYNGFGYFLPGIASVDVDRPPEVPERPSEILGGLERVIRLWWFKRRYRDPDGFRRMLSREEYRNSPYARQYEQLVAYAREHDIEVVLASFNMAVDQHSPEDVILFFEQTVPDVRTRILANRFHTSIVRAVADAHGLLAIEPSEGLNGAYSEAYLDIAHFTQWGRDRMAENVLEGLRPLLTRSPRPACRPRAG